MVKDPSAFLSHPSNAGATVCPVLNRSWREFGRWPLTVVATARIPATRTKNIRPPAYRRIWDQAFMVITVLISPSKRGRFSRHDANRGNKPYAPGAPACPGDPASRLGTD